jgi:hypothetical protein
MDIYLYAGNLSKNKQKGDKYGHMETSGRGRKPCGHLGHRPAPLRCYPAPHVWPWHCPCHRFMGATPQALPRVDLSRFASMVTMERSWIHGSTVMDLKPSYWPWNRLTSQIFTCATFTTTFGSQPRPYDQKAVKSRASRHPTYIARCPTSTPPPLLQT